MTFGYFILSVFVSIILFFIIGITIKPSANDGGMVFIIGIVLSLQLSLITAILLNKKTES
ncbi:lipopolysaccharide export LptBFGC system permease protein LptF [Paenibacillus sp. V4I7]|nr:lipopolysaccharide export LptBFGC system permease protein LptF [Paenibacillus sp. V4I7]MDQ0914034.1 lipopolysaccharide export LptBFGC system permease protein LptF [Paenibacillus sp. V4I5]